MMWDEVLKKMDKNHTPIIAAQDLTLHVTVKDRKLKPIMVNGVVAREQNHGNNLHISAYCNHIDQINC